VKRLIEYPLNDGSSVLVEVDEEARGGVVRRGGPSEVVAEKVTQTFETALEKIRPAAVELIAQFRNLSAPPQIAVVEFGVKLSAEAGAFIASVATEANFKVTLTWRRDS
jgi:Trypsin-co-occurring domain 1